MNQVGLMAGYIAGLITAFIGIHLVTDPEWAAPMALGFIIMVLAVGIIIEVHQVHKAALNQGDSE